MLKKGNSENPVNGQHYTCEWNDNGVMNIFNMALAYNYFPGCSGDDSEEGFLINVRYTSWIK